MKNRVDETSDSETAQVVTVYEGRHLPLAHGFDGFMIHGSMGVYARRNDGSWVILLQSPRAPRFVFENIQ